MFCWVLVAVIIISNTRDPLNTFKSIVFLWLVIRTSETIKQNTNKCVFASDMHPVMYSYNSGILKFEYSAAHVCYLLSYKIQGLTVADGSY